MALSRRGGTRFWRAVASHRPAAACWSLHMRTVAQRFASSARGEQPRASAGSMKNASSRQEDDLRPEYDFSSLKGGVRGKYYRRFRAGTNIVRLEPDLARVFPTDEAVLTVTELNRFVPHP